MISRLPKVETLDYKTVTPEERTEANRIYGAALSVSHWSRAWSVSQLKLLERGREREID